MGGMTNQGTFDEGSLNLAQPIFDTAKVDIGCNMSCFDLGYIVLTGNNIV